VKRIANIRFDEREREGMIWNFEKYKENVAMREDDGKSMTYQELLEKGNALSRVLPERSLVFLFCKNTIGAILGYTAFLNHGMVPILLKSDLERELQENLLRTYQPEYVWVEKKKAETEFFGADILFEAYGYVLLKTDLKNIQQNTEKNIEKDVAENAAENMPEIMETEEAEKGTGIFRKENGEKDGAETEEAKKKRLYKDLALLLTTSGSTGSPKLVRQSYENIIANTESIVKYLELDETEKPITTLPMNYTYGLSIINSHLYVGATLLLTEKTLMHKEFWSFFKEEGATSFGGVPYTYEILKKLRFLGMDLPSLRTMTQAGGKLSPELHKEFAEYAKAQGKHFVVMYGQTEATARMAYLPYEKSLEKYGSMGIAIPGGKFSLMDVEEKEITEPDIVGELVYRGKNVTLGYALCREDLAKGDERHGVLVTGDMAKMDKDGYFYIVGRKKRFLKIFGNRVNLDETERMIKSAFEELDCACAGIDDNMKVYITGAGKAEEIKKFLVNKTKLNPSAFEVMEIAEIPKNEAGKTLYSKLG
jgi:acyl-coenzyme A synthetase/AMP-(fatty) acid ligase